MKGSNVAIFDFDETIYDGDSMYDCFRFINKKTFYLIFLKYILYEIFLHKSIKKPSKSRFINMMTKDLTLKEMELKAEDFYETHKSKINHEAQLEIEEYKHDNYDIYISTASLDIWVKPFAKDLGLKLISTRYEYINDIRILKNNKGKEKVARIKKDLDLSKYTEIHAFGDSKADLFLKEIATEFFYKKF